MSRLDRSVVAYAFLAQAQRSDNDLLSGLMPIFKPIAKLHEGERFDPKAFSSLAGELYGLNVSAWAVESLVPRLEAAGVLVRIPVADGVHDYVYAQIDEQFTAVTEKDVAYVLNRFVAFARPIIADREEGLLNDDELKERFLQHIVDLDFVGAVLKPVKTDAPDGKPQLGLPKPPEQVEWENDKSRRARIEVLCASFIVDLFHKDKNLYELVARITAGALVSEVVLNFQNPETGLALNGLRVVLDAPFLMSALDLGNSDAFAVASSVCAQLREHGARLAVFRHSVEEIQDNLSAVLGAVDAGVGHGPTARRLTDDAFRAYASAIKDSPNARLHQEGIEILEPPNGPHSFKWFTEENEATFCQSLGFYQNRRAQERDAASVAGVIRMRAGLRVRMGKVNACRALFVTANPWVAERSKKALLKARVYEEGDVPPSMTDRYVAGLLWVIYGGKAGELPTHVLLANCAAAIEPKADLIHRMHRFLSSVDEKQAKYFRALMTDERAGQYLSQLSLGDSSYVSQDNFTAILESMKSALLEKHEVERLNEVHALEREAEARARDHQAQQARLEDDLRAARAEALGARNETGQVRRVVRALEKQAAEDRRERAEEKRYLVEWSVRRALNARSAAHWVAGILLGALGVIATVFANSAVNDYVRWGGVFGGGLVILFSFWRIPEILFGRLIDKLRDRVFYNALVSRGISPDQITAMTINWRTGTVQYKSTDPETF